MMASAEESPNYMQPDHMQPDHMQPDHMQPDQPLISCLEAEAYLHLFVEAELDQLRSVQLEDHLTACDSCRVLKAELDSEQLWLIENAVRSPTLSENFASKVSAEIRREAPGRDLRQPAFSSLCWYLQAETAETSAAAPRSTSRPQTAALL